MPEKRRKYQKILENIRKCKKLSKNIRLRNGNVRKHQKRIENIKKCQEMNAREATQ